MPTKPHSHPTNTNDLPQTANQWLAYGEQWLIDADIFLGHGRNNYTDEAAALIVYALNIHFETPESQLDQPLDSKQQKSVITVFKQRTEERIPTPYITGEMPFADIPFFIDRRVLVPRSPFAQLIMQQFDGWLPNKAEIHCLDLCCGCGCLGIATLLHCPNVTQLTLSDLSEEAITVAQKNIDRLAPDAKVQIIQSDLFNRLPSTERFDLIICNPPYLSNQVMDNLPKEYRYEPQLGLIGKRPDSQQTDGLELVDEIIQSAHRWLTKDGVLFLEVGASIDAFRNKYSDLAYLELQLQNESEEANDAEAVAQEIQGMLYIKAQDLPS